MLKQLGWRVVLSNGHAWAVFFAIRLKIRVYYQCVVNPRVPENHARQHTQNRRFLPSQNGQEAMNIREERDE